MVSNASSPFTSTASPHMTPPHFGTTPSGSTDQSTTYFSLLHPYVPTFTFGIIIHRKVAARVDCVFNEQDAQGAARAEQHQLQQQQFSFFIRSVYVFSSSQGSWNKYQYCRWCSRQTSKLLICCSTKSPGIKGYGGFEAAW